MLPSQLINVDFYRPDVRDFINDKPGSMFFKVLDTVQYLCDSTESELGPESLQDRPPTPHFPYLLSSIVR